MNAPAKRFSLSRILTPEKLGDSAPTAPPAAEVEPKPLLTALPPAKEPVLPPSGGEELAAKPAEAPPAEKKPIPKTKTEPASDERHAKKKRSYSVDMSICADLEDVAWFMGRSSSSIVEDLMRKYIQSHRDLLEKARAVKADR